MDVLAVVDSAEALPKTTGWVSMMLGACIVVLVIGGAVVTVGLIGQKASASNQFMGQVWNPGKLVNVGVGAMILGSAAGLVTYGSNMYTPAKMAEPESRQPAYETVNDCEPMSFETKDDTARAKQILGEDQYSSLNTHDPKKEDPSWDFENSYWEDVKGKRSLVGNETGRVFNEVKLTYKPEKTGGECTTTVNVCYQVQLEGGSTFNGRSGGWAGGRPTEEFNAGGYEESQCGEAKKL